MRRQEHPEPSTGNGRGEAPRRSSGLLGAVIFYLSIGLACAVAMFALVFVIALMSGENAAPAAAFVLVPYFLVLGAAIAIALPIANWCLGRQSRGHRG